MVQFFLILCALPIDYVLASNVNKTIDLQLLPEIPEHKAKRKVYPTVENIRNEGYKAETHNVTTLDGYILEMHRIPYHRHESAGDSTRPIVFLMHGMTAISNAFISLGTKNAIGYNLADAGFDVWMGNARGTKNSRLHVTLNPDDKAQAMKFFDFSWEEIGLYDISAMIDYILIHTRHKKLHYIGHSQGGTAFLVLTSMRPEYNEKIASAHLLAGVGYQNHFPNENLKILASFTDIIFDTARNLNALELSPSKATGMITPGISFCRTLYSSICKSVHFKYLHVCNLLNIEDCSREVLQLPRDKTINETGDKDEFEGGGSLKQVAHYGQNIRDSAFSRWNYSSQIANKEMYGTQDPPLYNLKLITVNVTMHYTVGDILLDERDVLSMVRDMPNAAARKVARDSFLHQDFTAAADVKELVTDHIIQAIKCMKEILFREDNNSSFSLPEVELVTAIPIRAANSALGVTTNLYILFFSLRLFRSL